MKRVMSGEFSHTERALELAHRNTSDSTVRKQSDGLRERIARISLESQREEEDSEGSSGGLTAVRTDKRTSSSSLPMIDELSLALPVADHSRTPIRTKRRSLTSQLPLERRLSHHSTSSQWQAFPPDDYLALLNADLPPLFSTPSEKVLLNRLADLGVDTGQLIHSVKNDACDCSSATWWILRLKQLERGETDDVVQTRCDRRKERTKKAREKQSLPEPARAAEPADSDKGVLATERSVPRTPDNGFLAPSSAYQERPISSHSTYSTSSANAEATQSPTNSGLSVPTDQSPTKERKSSRSQSMNMLQRATSVLVGGMKKADPTEHLRELRDHKSSNHDSKDQADTATDASDDKSSNRVESPTKTSRFLPKMTKSESDPTLLSLATGQGQNQQKSSQPSQHRSPTTSPTLRTRSYHAGVSNEDSPPKALDLDEPRASKLQKKDSIWNTFRHLFNEDRRRQRKRDPSPLRAQGRPPVVVPSRAVRAGISSRTSMPSTSRRTSFDGRPMYSRGHSSVTSRRSSIASNHIPDFTINTHDGLYHSSLNRRASGRSARSGGTMTPNSERGQTSRPGSINSRRGSRRSSMMRSPTVQSDSSGRFRQTGPTSPLHDYHRRAASGSASTRVRHIKVLHEAKAIRPSSVASSTRSNASSRASSIHGVDDSDDMRDDSIQYKRNDSVSSLTKTRARSPLSRGAGKHKPLRDVFSKKEDDEWESEDDDFAGGLGQGASLPPSAATSFQSQWNKPRNADAGMPSARFTAKYKSKGEDSHGSTSTTNTSGSIGSSSGGTSTTAGSGGGSRARRAGLPQQRSQAPVIEEEEEEDE